MCVRLKTSVCSGRRVGSRSMRQACRRSICHPTSMSPTAAAENSNDALVRASAAASSAVMSRCVSSCEAAG
eukprot:5031690-Prymnesium_polylepis.1